MKPYYSDKIIKHFKNPKNLGSIKNPSGEGRFQSPVCGDVTTFQIKVKDGKIKDVKFVTLGCATSIAAGSVLSGMVKGKTPEQALKITAEDISKNLDVLPKPKLHCAAMVQTALKKAIQDYRKK